MPLAARWAVDVVRRFSQTVAEQLAAADPDRFVARSGEAHRVGRIFVDYLRNGEGATAVAAYSLRARPGLGVAMPVAWEALDEVGSATEWSIANALDHLASRRADPWAELDASKQSLAGPLKALGLQP
ncbi:hypothetical protein LXT12_03290 [Pelomonas sp. P7]|uniref:DNA ligase D polymerase domain-containing protein n=1 Tax=Pelomonas caseinilytica TaxID=2906763 RepID=A0ABS8XBT3_9BURK|nr:hypothetical protein [Pelomonas sp. P7]MCE4536281.1 hypothetical protein [Pelomonas sp. P7]